MIEILAQIEGRHRGGGTFNAGIVLWDDKVVEAAPILIYMKHGKWTRTRVRDWCRKKGWKISVVHEIERSRNG